MKKIKYMFVIWIFIFLGFILYWKYFYTYSEGYHSGVLNEFSYKGNFIKSYDGEMTVRSSSGELNELAAPIKFNFTVTDKNIALQLDSIQGQLVTLHYKQKNGAAFWRGDWRYIVDGVELIP
jgi:hypothetical protein